METINKRSFEVVFQALNQAEQDGTQADNEFIEGLLSDLDRLEIKYNNF